MTRRASLAGIVLILLAAAAWAADAPRVTVFTPDGRRLTGHLDPATDATWLWISTSTSRIQLRSRTPWSEVTAVLLNNEVRTPGEVQSAATQPFDIPVQAPAPGQPDGSDKTRWLASETLPACRILRHWPIRKISRVESIEVRTQVAQWDADAQADGLQLELFPLDAGRLIPAEGQVTARLLAEPVQPGSRVRLLSAGSSEVEIGRWTVPAATRQPGRPAVVRLPFQRVDPVRDRRYGPFGLLEVSWGIPGQGSFQAVTPVVLKDPWQDAFSPRSRRYWPD